MSNTQKNYYELLDIPRTADANIIKKAYHKMAMKYHPDKNQGDKKAEEMFKQVSEAYEVLSDPQEKDYYDRMGTRISAGSQHRRPSVDPFDIFRSAFRERSFGSTKFSYAKTDPFGMFEGLEYSFVQESRVSIDNRIVYRTTVQEILKGDKPQIEFERQIACNKCNGQGFQISNGKCKACGGHGQLRHRDSNLIFISACDYCQGTGNNMQKCSECNGMTYKTVLEKVVLTIPYGIKPMSTLRLKEKGNEIIFSNKRMIGDTYIIVDYPPKYKGVILDNGNIYISIKVPFDTVMAQKNIKVNVLGCRELELKLDATKKSGYQYKIPGAGVTKENNAYVKVNSDFPKNDISKKNREKLIKILREIYGKPSTSFEPSFIDL